MNIIIVGSGKVGYTLAQFLSKDGHDITIIDKSDAALQRASETLDVMCIRGNGANVRTLIEAGIEMRHNTQGRNVSMYLTNVACTPAGSMSGNTVMSMRPIPYNQVVKAVQISGAIPKVHGAPLHIGDPSVIGIEDISKPDFGDPVDIHEGEVPVFWACGVTPQAVVMNSKPPFAITHAPGCMLITDTKNVDLKG